MARMIVKLIKEICEEEKIKYKSMSYDWIIQMEKEDKKCFVYGYSFSNNNSAADKICSDKAALSLVLSSHNLPCVMHYYFPNPKYVGYSSNEDRKRIHDFFLKNKKIVLKNNNGSGGNDVFKITDESQLDNAIDTVWGHYEGVAVAKYENIAHEYRIIMLNGEPLLVYEKIRPYVIGDGLHCLKELISNKNIELDDELDLDVVLAKDERLDITWKHNLGQGADNKMIEDDDLKEKLITLAAKAVKALDINFCSCDLIDVDGELKVLEINSGVMMESFSSTNEKQYQLAKEIYRKAILAQLQ